MPEPRPTLTARVVAARRDGDQILLETELHPPRQALLAARGDWTLRATGERLLDPRLLDRAERLAEEARTWIGDGGGVLGPTDQLAVARYMVRGQRPEERRVGDTPLENLYLLNVLRRVRGEERVEEVFEPEHRQALFTLFLETPSFVMVEELMASLRRWDESELTPLGLRLGLAGDVAVSQAMIGAIVRTQVRSLWVSLAGILLLTTLFARSLRIGLLCLVPPAFAVAFDFALMGVVGIPLGVATSMFAAMTLGLGIDFAIHLVERLDSPAVRGLPPGERVGEALAVVTPPLLTNALVLALGFGVLLVSRGPANGRLGFLIVASTLVCLTASLLLLPALYPGSGGRGEP
jgi:hypothetical protein